MEAALQLQQDEASFYNIEVAFTGKSDTTQNPIRSVSPNKILVKNVVDPH